MLCPILGVSRSGYYKWLNSEKSARELENERILAGITEIYEQVNGIYGYRRLADEYNARHETNYGDHRIYRLAQKGHLYAKIRRKRRRYRKSTPEITAANVLNREFAAEYINEKWVTDVTELQYGAGNKAYLSAILDLKTRSIVSYEIGHSNNNQLVFRTLDKAIYRFPDAHPLLHSDRGYQYTSRSFRLKLDNAGIAQSMSRVGRCIDNGPMEGFWGTLKAEMFNLARFDDYETLVASVEEYIYFYNYFRRQRKLGRLAPENYRQVLEAQAG